MAYLSSSSFYIVKKIATRPFCIFVIRWKFVSTTLPSARLRGDRYKYIFFLWKFLGEGKKFYVFSKNSGLQINWPFKSTYRQISRDSFPTYWIHLCIRCCPASFGQWAHFASTSNILRKNVKKIATRPFCIFVIRWKFVTTTHPSARLRRDRYKCIVKNNKFLQEMN